MLIDNGSRGTEGTSTWKENGKWRSSKMPTTFKGYYGILYNELN